MLVLVGLLPLLMSAAFHPRWVHLSGFALWLPSSMASLAWLGRPVFPLTVDAASTALILACGGVVVELVHRASTARRTARAELARREAYYAALLERSSDIVLVIDASGVVRYVNAAAHGRLGYRPADLVGKSGFDFVLPGDDSATPENFERFTDTGDAPDRIEVQLRHADGHAIWFDVTWGSLGLAEGPSMLVMNLRDITQRKRYEDHIRRQEEEYKRLLLQAQSQARDLQLLDTARAELSRQLDVKSIFRVVVEVAAQRFGYTHVSSYLIEDGVAVLQHQVGYYLPRVITRISLDRGVVGRTVRTGEAQYLPDVSADPDFLAAGDNLTSEICVPLRDGGAIIGILNLESRNGQQLTQQDLALTSAVAEQASLAINRARLYERALEASRLKSEFMATMSH